MATRFVRIDLSDDARDFRPIAVEPGVPMLDRSGSHSKILFRWLGGLVAEPVWEGESVSFYVRDDHGGRLEDVICQPATEQDLQSILKDDVAKLKDRLEKSHPETGTERALHKILVRTVQELLDDPNRNDLDSYFFRYRDVQGTWRLGWCWGYQRKDQEPAPAVVCTDPDCNLLFVRRPGKSPKCPSCESALSYRPVKKTNWKWTALVGLLLFSLGAGIVWWALRPAKLVAVPGLYQGPAGTRIEFAVFKTGLFSKKDVTHDTVGIVYDPRIARYDSQTGAATLLAQGHTVIRFQSGDMKTEADLSVEPPTNPDELIIEPSLVKLGIGTTARPKVIGKYKGDVKLDLTETAHWKPLSGPIVYAKGGLIEGLAKGTAKVTATYRANMDSPTLDATAQVNVSDINFKGIELGIKPLPVGVGRGSELQADAIAEDGEHYSVLESSLLKTDVVKGDDNPRDLAKVEGRTLKGERAGSGKLAASFGPKSLAAEKEFTVVVPPGVGPMVVPEKLDLVVNEITDLNVITPSTETIKITSASPAVAEVTADNRVIGRTAGTTEVEVAQGDWKQTVPVTVTAAEFGSIAIDPSSIVVEVDGKTRPKVMAQVKGDSPRTAEIAPDRIEVEKRPSPRYADFTAKTGELKGIAPTKPDSPENLALRLGSLKTPNAPVEVVIAPCRVEATPPGPVDVPAGQRAKVQAWANYSGGRRVEIPPERLKWQAEKSKDAAPGLELQGNRVDATKPGGGPLSVYATYGGRESNHIVFKSVDADPTLKLAVKADRAEHHVGDAGHVTIVGQKADGTETELVPGGVFKSSDDKVAKINDKTGSFRAVSPGDATVSVTHIAAKEPGTAKVKVISGTPRDIPVSVRIVENHEAQSVRFPVGSHFKDFRVEAKYADGFTRLATKKATLTTPELPQSAFLTAARGELIGVRPGTTVVNAEFEGVKAEKPLGAEVTGKVEVDKLVVEPGPIVMRPGENFSLHAIGFKDGKSVGDITGLGNITWQSNKPQVARVNGPSVNGAGLGEAEITAQFEGITSKPATRVTVTDTIAGKLKVEPRKIEMHVGESRQVGSDITISRSDMDVSEQCDQVRPLLPGVVHYVPQTRSLVAAAPGTTPVVFAVGDKTVTVPVEVLGNAGAIDGEVIVEPRSVILAPGQAQSLRVYVVTPAGERFDRTSSAIFRSSDDKAVTVQGTRACAMAPGNAEIKAVVSGAKKPGTVAVQVNEEDMTELYVDEPEMNLSVGDVKFFRVEGAAPVAGKHDVFPHPDLKVTTTQSQPGMINVRGCNAVDALAIGTAAIDIAWRDKAKQQIQVNVINNPLTDLRIRPADEVTVPAGDAVPYEVTARRGGEIKVLGPEDGVKLFVTDPKVAEVIGDTHTVGANNPGRTTVFARLGDLKSPEAGLVVAPRGVAVDRVPGVDVIDPGVDVVPGVVEEWYHHGHHRGGGVDVIETGPGGTVVDGTAPAANVTGLRFLPDKYNSGTNAEPYIVRVVEVLEGGRDGREVTTDPNLQLTEPSDVVKLDKTDRGPQLTPLHEGQTKVDATLGDLKSIGPLLINIGGGDVAGGKLVVNPNPLNVWLGEGGKFDSVAVDPGTGEQPFPVEYKVTPAEGQNFIKVEGENRISGTAVGNTQVTVTPADPKYQGLSATVPVQVAAADKLVITPAEISLEVGQRTEPVSVMAQNADGTTTAVQATIESMEPNVLASVPGDPNTFEAKSQGQTKLRATYRGAEVFATVSITGKRFVDVKATVANEGRDGFDASIEVLAAGSEGELEYRVYPAGQAPPDNWTANQPEGDSRKVTLHSGQVPYKERGELYQLVIEARDKATNSVQQYPLTFQLTQVITTVKPQNKQ